MIETLLEVTGERLLIPLVVVAVGVGVAKGAFSLVRSRSQHRKDFLDLFREHEAQSDLWMTVAVRHVFGAYLPASLIRQLMSSPQPGRALLEVGSAWGFIDMDDETGELTWRRKLFRTPKTRRVVVRILSVVYFVLGVTSLSLGYICVTGQMDGHALWIAWVYAILCGGGAFAALAYGDSLNDASKAAERWLVFGGTFVVVEIVYELVLAGLAGRIAPWLGRHGRWFNRATGATFVGMGTVLARAERS